jgi:membrane protein DedA with SNARE-associated domain
MAGEYAVLLALTVLAGIGFPGPGDSGLIAAALLAAEGHLSLAAILIVAFAGCLIGRAVGYELGAWGGRPLLQRPGLLHGLRSRTLEKGDLLFERFPRSAVLLVPAPIVGIYRVSPLIFALASLWIALSWTLATGLIAYFVGEAAIDAVGTAGAKGVLLIIVLAAAGFAGRYLWRRRRAPGAVPRGDG